MIPEGDYRTSARVILLAPDDTVLHMGGDRCRDGVVRWYTPGGGVEAGEDPAAAAIREVHEETGLRIDPAALIGPVARGVYVCFPGGRLHVQQNWYFFHRVERFAPRMTAGAGYELGLGFDWLPIDACGSTDGMIDPHLLVALVKRLRDGDVPAAPVELGGSYGPVWDQ
ncbi:NUDIX domain-containing protein [Glycomyces niveus]|uniref:NUDIX domain-containing protein n=1 Tax=Glycomyces niveus TaxID=2820287 RepID=A0ABS3U5T7_9ACTN|nr:NUDIX domain-containing protein [Glycomyces sp. NEAU-S30]MBO3734123.1 NUDIX domain-containing protein [Glycomyces sp. NEAU-S30]